MVAVSILFARSDSVYKTLHGCDVWDIDRDARLWPGGNPCVCHPPCRLWGALHRLATRARPDEKDLARFSVRMIRQNGGVLEHPKASKLWPEMRLPEPGEVDEWGGFTLEVLQYWWGHRADKATRLYVCGCDPANVPPIPYRGGRATHVITQGIRMGDPGWRPRVTNPEREHTPRAFAVWLVRLAQRCKAPVFRTSHLALST